MNDREALRDFLVMIEEEPGVRARVTIDADEATLAVRGEYLPRPIEQRVERADWADSLGTHAEAVDGEEPVVVRVVGLNDDLHDELRGIERAPIE